ncbi:MAG: glycoside hydrolase family 32 protein [Bacilli bacterium]|nr:glycoside hydrolase family 32 protein [Bacilli bacterium]
MKTKRIFGTIALALMVMGCKSVKNKGDLVSQKFSYDEFPLEYNLNEEVDVSKIKIKNTYSSGDIDYVSLERKYVKGLDNITSTIGVKPIDLKYNKLEDRVNIFVYYGDHAYDEDYRSQYHYSKDKGWINDPNGLFYNELTKEYHMYYQDGPRFGSDPNNFWSSRAWGHAVSKDLVHWQQIDGYAIYPQPDGFGDIWSGCCVVDEKNTSGLFDDSVHPKERVVAIYTVTRPQQQYCLAYSSDGGYTFTKYNKNPIIDNSAAQYGGGFRDSKCYWIEDETRPNGGLRLLVTAGESSHCIIFTSDNLLDWRLNSYICDMNGNRIGHECPTLFKLPVDGDKNNMKYVFSANQNWYMLGDLKKNNLGNYEFVAETDKIRFYSSNTHAAMDWWLNSSRVVLTAWIGDNYMATNPQDTPNRKWEGMMTVPYEAKLITGNDGKPYLHLMPISELEILRGFEYYDIDDFDITPDDDNFLADIYDSTFEINLDVNLLNKYNNSRFGFNVRKGENGEYISIYYSIDQNLLVVDQTKTHVAKYKEQVTVCPLEENQLKLKILIDKSAIEVFANDGKETIQTIYFISEENLGIEFFTSMVDIHFNSFSMYSLKSIYHKNNL